MLCIWFRARHGRSPWCYNSCQSFSVLRGLMLRASYAPRPTLHVLPPSSGPRKSVLFGQWHWAPLPLVTCWVWSVGGTSWRLEGARREARHLFPPPLLPCQLQGVMLDQGDDSSQAVLSVSYRFLWAKHSPPLLFRSSMVTAPDCCEPLGTE